MKSSLYVSGERYAAIAETEHMAVKYTVTSQMPLTSSSAVAISGAKAPANTPPSCALIEMPL